MYVQQLIKPNKYLRFFLFCFIKEKYGPRKKCTPIINPTSLSLSLLNTSFLLFYRRK